MYNFFSNETNYEKVIHTILNGGQIVWMNIPWKQHVEEYLEKDILLIRYEDMRSKPLEKANEILNYLDIIQSKEFVEETVAKHSFERKKEYHIKKGHKRAVNFMRKGQSGEWKEKLTKDQISLIMKELGPFMKSLNYL